jgi:hypothetical protein
MCNNEYTGQATKFPSMFMELCSISEYHLEHNSWLVILQMFFKIQNWCVKQKKIIYNVKIDIMEKGKFWSKLKKKKKTYWKEHESLSHHEHHDDNWALDRVILIFWLFHCSNKNHAWNFATLKTPKEICEWKNMDKQD